MAACSKKIFDELVKSVEDIPEETCGFLFSKVKNSNFITGFLPVKNMSSSDKRFNFEISPYDYLKAEKLAENLNLEILGIYHTHLNHFPIPSDTDKKFAFPFFDYLIISLKQLKFYEAKLWTLDENLKFLEKKLSLTN